MQPWPQSPQSIRVSRDGEPHDAVVSWRSESLSWGVAVESSAFGRVEAWADDAFEALCRVREELEPHGWRIGVAGALVDVWPSGMARDQGGGLAAYRMTPEAAGPLVRTFDPVDPSTVVTLDQQRAVIDRLFEGYQSGPPPQPRRQSRSGQIRGRQAWGRQVWRRFWASITRMSLGPRR